MPILAEDFDAFWQQYPRRHAKLDAFKAYAQARKLASAEDILAGVERYKRLKPDYADWKLPAGWLRTGRWMDEDDQPVVVQREYWSDECARVHGGACSKQWDHVSKMRESA